LGPINLVGVVHEKLGVPEFKKGSFEQGNLYLDQDKSLFKLLGDRWLGFTGFLSPKVWGNLNRAKGKGFEGNMEGEGRLLGGLLVVGPGDQGVIFEYKEEVWGDHADLKDVLEACKMMNKA